MIRAVFTVQTEDLQDQLALGIKGLKRDSRTARSWFLDKPELGHVIHPQMQIEAVIKDILPRPHGFEAVYWP